MQVLLDRIRNEGGAARDSRPRGLSADYRSLLLRDRHVHGQRTLCAEILARPHPDRRAPRGRWPMCWEQTACDICPWMPSPEPSNCRPSPSAARASPVSIPRRAVSSSTTSPSTVRKKRRRRAHAPTSWAKSYGRECSTGYSVLGVCESLAGSASSLRSRAGAKQPRVILGKGVGSNPVRHDLCRVGPGEANASGTRKYVPSRRPTRIRLPFCVVRIPEERVRCSYWTVDTGLWWAGGSASKSAEPSRIARLVPPYENRAEQDWRRPAFRPGGTADSSPAIYRRVGGQENIGSRTGRDACRFRGVLRASLRDARRAFGECSLFPSTEVLGYSQRPRRGSR